MKANDNRKFHQIMLHTQNFFKKTSNSLNIKEHPAKKHIDRKLIFRKRIFYVIGKPTGLVNDFIKWTLTDGQKYIPEQGYVVLPKSTIDDGLKKVE